MAGAIALAFVACNSTDSLNPSTPETDTPSPAAPTDGALTPVGDPQVTSLYVGGIPFGTFDQPNTQFGSRYDGAMRIIGPSMLLEDLKAIKARGGKVAINFAGGRSRYTDGAGNFSMTLWKASVNRFRNINFDSYIKDGTIIGHYLMDEPQNKSKWNGKAVAPATIDQMAQYSKQLWPGMTTMIRAYPDYLDSWSGSYRYLDAAWAQYVARFGSVSTFISQNISRASRQGLALIVGLNVLRGGPGGGKMTPTQIKDYGSALLGSSYPCAFLSWEYNSTYLSSSGVRDAMDYVRRKAKARSYKSCRGN
jgi:hypothetical protein